MKSQSCQPQHPCPGSVVSGVGMVVLCLCHGAHAWVASGVAPGKMQSHFALNTGGVVLRFPRPNFSYNTQYIIIILFSCLGDGGCLSDLVRYINVLLCLDMKYII